MEAVAGVMRCLIVLLLLMTSKSTAFPKKATREAYCISVKKSLAALNRRISFAKSVFESSLMSTKNVRNKCYLISKNLRDQELAENKERTRAVEEYHTAILFIQPQIRGYEVEVQRLNAELQSECNFLSSLAPLTTSFRRSARRKLARVHDAAMQALTLSQKAKQYSILASNRGCLRSAKSQSQEEKNDPVQVPPVGVEDAGSSETATPDTTKANYTDEEQVTDTASDGPYAPSLEGDRDAGSTTNKSGHRNFNKKRGRLQAQPSA
ncbi:Putative cell surface-expressed gene family [Trypanosoma congolense IL3000]|uniref:Putative cell surface-expressed gene family n=1 Tax=Trypanosoma congolense (strain IL3000) TaxID=1068625 RepID=F9W3P0_TRYCI|nr:Putative cell surface-expressed gene family [Trypanosoma congolense IL3000]